MPISVPEDRVQRLEDKLDEINSSLQKLILIDERQMRQGERLGTIEERMSKIEMAHLQLNATVSKWIWFGTGIVTSLTITFSLVQAVAMYYRH